jgi:hypothetical protein
MKHSGCFSRLFYQQSSIAMPKLIAGDIGIAVLLMMTGIAVAQLPTPGTQASVPEGYTSHTTVDLGGHMVDLTGSGAMYGTLVNTQSGPRVLGERFEMHALPGKKHTLIDSLSAVGNGFGGDPNNFTKLDFHKGKVYEFSGIFRRDRQYFDYDLLGNPNITTGLSIPIGPSNAPTGSLPWPQVKQSPVMFNTVRRMTDTSVTLFPLSKVTFRAGYSQNIFQGPSLSPTYSIAKYDALLEQYQRNSTDDFMGAMDWKPVAGTKLTFEEQITHYKADSYFTLNPNGFTVQEADGTPAYLGNWDSETPYGISSCATSSMGSGYISSSHYTILSPAPTTGGLPVINAACSVVTSYMRSQPTRIFTPTETFRLQSSSIKNLTVNGDVLYTRANMNLPNYYENVQGLDTVQPNTKQPYYYGVRSITYSGGYAAAQRSVIAANFGMVWQASKTVSISEQVNYSSVHQPGHSDLPIAATLSTPTDTATSLGNASINYNGPLTAGTAVALPHGVNGVLTNNYFGQEFLTNNLTLSWDAASRAMFAVTYRYSNHNIGQGVPHAGSIPTVLADPVNGTVAITENGGIFNVALRPMNNWDINGTAEVFYADNVFTAVGPRQTKHYRVHTKYKPRPWATFTGAFNDLERHNNTNNNQATVAAGLDPWEGPLNHVDHNRSVSLGAVLAPSEHYGLDFSYSYSDVYTATNICYNNGATATLPGTASTTSTGAANVCPGIYARGSTTVLSDWLAKDFMDAPTQYGSVSLSLSPVDKLHSNIGYRISSVSGSQFFNDARSVNGSLQSAYQSPFVNAAWTVHTALIFNAEYNFYGYGEGGPSGPQSCSTSTTLTSLVVPCISLSYPTGLTESPSGLTAARNFHANNVTLGVHYEF